MKKKHYLVYKTTNLLNGKIYIGQHQTNDLNDGYLGSGKELSDDIDIFGRENFKREILFDFDSFEEMDNKERELVNEDFVNREDTYNMRVGGQNSDGFSTFAKNGGLARAKLFRENKEYQSKMSSKISNNMKRLWKEHPEYFDNFSKKRNKYAFLGKHHTEETKKKISEKAKLRTGEKNNAFGTTWICNLELKENKKVKKELVDEYLRTGWILGRRMSFYKKG